jgi:hypothetical protein
VKYHYLRLFLVPDRQINIFEQLGEEGDKLSRTEYLQKIFNDRINFTHRKRPLVYLPVGEEPRSTGPVLLGRIGRPHLEMVNDPPEDGFAEREIETWRASNFLIDTGDYKEGQKVAMQTRGDVGLPLPIVSSLVAHINSVNSSSGWVLEISPMTEAANFWDVVRQYEGALTSITFNFVTPNVLGLRSQLNAGLKDAREKNNAHRVALTMTNEKGNLELNKENIHDAVEYVSEGGGTAKLKAGSKVVYDSEKDEKEIDLPIDEPIVVSRKSLWKDMVSKIF